MNTQAHSPLFISAYPGCCLYEPRDCDDVRQSGSTESGVYSVTPEGTYTSYDVYCDMGPGNESWLVSLSPFTKADLHTKSSISLSLSLF